MSIRIPTSKRETKHTEAQGDLRASPTPSLQRGLHPELGLQDPVCDATVLPC